METTELQNSIIQKVLHTNDNQLLDYLNQLLNERSEKEIYQLSEFEKSIISESRADYQSGKTISSDLKNILHHKLDIIDDESFLSGLIDLLDAKSDVSVYKTTDEQRAKIIEGRDQIAMGDFFTNEQVKKEIDEWLSKE